MPIELMETCRRIDVSVNQCAQKFILTNSKMQNNLVNGLRPNCNGCGGT